MKIVSGFGKLAADIRNDMKKAEAHFAMGVTLGTREAVRGLRNSLREQVRSAGLGPKIEKTWQDKTFPKGGASASAAGIVFSKAPKIIAAWDKGTVIKSSRGMYLAIPTANAPQKGTGNTPISPSNWPASKYGPLRLVKTRRALLLVADGLRASYSRKTGKQRGYKKASATALRTGKGLTTVVMFILVPQVKVPKRLDVMREWRKWSAVYPSLITKNLNNAKYN